LAVALRELRLSPTVGVGSKREGSHVVENRDSWPVSSQHRAAVGVAFAERDGAHSGPFESEGKSADAGE
jgi:hypothetical protein